LLDTKNATKFPYSAGCLSLLKWADDSGSVAIVVRRQVAVGWERAERDLSRDNMSYKASFPNYPERTWRTRLRGCVSVKGVSRIQDPTGVTPRKWKMVKGAATGYNTQSQVIPTIRKPVSTRKQTSIPKHITPYLDPFKVIGILGQISPNSRKIPNDTVNGPHTVTRLIKQRLPARIGPKGSAQKGHVC